jgi:hypothetical protein
MKLKRGSPTKLNERTAKRICAAVRRGNTRFDAALCAGIHVDTFLLWMRRGRQEGSGFYYQFYQSVKKAEAQFVDDNIKVIQKAKGKSWQAGAWLLERRRPDDFAQRARLDHSGHVNSEMTLKLQTGHDFYANAARIQNNLLTEAAQSSIENSDGPIEVQALNVRTPVGQNGNGTNGKHRGARSNSERIQRGGSGGNDLVGGSDLQDD